MKIVEEKEQVKMWIREVFLGFIGLASGFAVAAGVFAFIISVGVVPRMIGESKTAKDVLIYEDMILLGGTLGNLCSLFQWSIPFGMPLLVLYGISAGVFTGCLAVALAEILNSFPIIFRRLRIKEGLQWMVFFMAMGKTFGALYFYMNHMQKF